MGAIQKQETELYDNVWSGIGHYGDHAPGEVWAPAFVAMTRASVGATVLDAGCGSGKGARALSRLGFRVAMCDLTSEGLTDAPDGAVFFTQCLWHPMPAASDWVYCCDVMEHVPTEFTMLAVRELLAAARYGVFFSIAFVPDQFGALLGRPLHQTVEGFTWWKARLAELGEVLEARDCLQTGLFLVRAR